ncbi:LHFPL2 [Branchiostoma lanceolatum]|uniref:LHFPL2 protein n=1 Tax=Branchiostoma lanceolatum TaxID=7740 RepID=A0A8J9ZF74_BRALA|nr:LHFPL2 [Branchiostoma lanceolatum]
MSCYVIVTCRSLLWTLLSIAAALANLAALMTAQWLVGQPRKAGIPGVSNANASRQTSPEEYYRPTIGIYNRCTSLHYFGEIFHDSCGPYITSFSELPSNFWKATLVFMGMGILLLVIVVFTSLLGFCVHAIGKKSIFNISGLLQAIAGTGGKGERRALRKDRSWKSCLRSSREETWLPKSRASRETCITGGKWGGGLSFRSLWTHCLCGRYGQAGTGVQSQAGEENSLQDVAKDYEQCRDSGTGGASRLELRIQVGNVTGGPCTLLWKLHTAALLSGLFLIIALVLYPAGWGSDRVQDLCGYRASPYYINECTLGWAFYCAVGGTLLSFVCAILSVQADIATSSDKVEDEILEGKNLICLL